MIIIVLSSLSRPNPIKGALDAYDALARKLYDKSISDEAVAEIKHEMSQNLNLMVANRHETLAEATRLYETVIYPSWIVNNFCRGTKRSTH